MAEKALTKAEFFAKYAAENGSDREAELVAMMADNLDLARALTGVTSDVPDDALDADALKALRAAGISVSKSKSRPGEWVVDRQSIGDDRERQSLSRLRGEAERAWVDYQEEQAQAAEEELAKVEEQADKIDAGEVQVDLESTSVDAGTPVPRTAAFDPAADAAVGVAGDMPTVGGMSAGGGPQPGDTEPSPYIGLPDMVFGGDGEWLGYQYEEERPGERVVSELDRGGLTAGRMTSRPAPPLTRRPMYEYGDELQGLSWNEDKKGRIQAELEEAGYLERGAYRPRRWDAETQKAFAELLAQANLYGLNWRKVLDGDLSAVRSDPTWQQSRGGGGVAPLVYSLPDPDELGLVAERVSSEILGRRFTEQERQAFVSAYTADERNRQRAAYEADVSGMEATTYQSVDPTAAAELYARRIDPGGYEAQGAADFYTQLLNFIGVSYG